MIRVSNRKLAVRYKGNFPPLFLLPRPRGICQVQRIQGGVYNAFKMDSKWSEEIEVDFKSWRQTDTPADFQHLTFDEDKPKDDSATSEAGTNL